MGEAMINQNDFRLVEAMVFEAAKNGWSMLPPHKDAKGWYAGSKRGAGLNTSLFVYSWNGKTWFSISCIIARFGKDFSGNTTIPKHDDVVRIARSLEQRIDNAVNESLNELTVLCCGRRPTTVLATKG